MDFEDDNEKRVKIGFLEDKPVILAALGAKISQTPFEKGDIQKLYEDCQADQEGSEKLVNLIMERNGHLIFGDFLPYAITLENLSRLAAIYFWRNVNVHNLIFGAGIEASLRVIKPNRYKELVGKLGEAAFQFYQRAIQRGIPEQDARYLLPQGTLTRMIFFAPPRYLAKLASSLQSTPLKELQEIGRKIEELVKEKFGFRFPQETLPSQWPFWGREEIEEKIFLDYQGKVPSLSLNMGLRGSLAMHAQLVRQRLILCQIEPLEQIARRGRFVVPPTFSEDIKKEYQELAHYFHEKQIELIKKKDPNFVYFLLMGQEARARIYGKGTALLEISKARSEGVAQWEIRNVVGIPITRELARYEELKNNIGPRCQREKRCIEPPTFKTKKAICKAFEKAKGNWQGTLEELLELLKEDYETFQV